MNDQEILALGRDVVRAEGEVIVDVSDQLNDAFVRAVHLVAECTGKIMITGAGTSGATARRMAHLFATCGMSAFFVHSCDALHGASAAAGPGDLLIALSKAGKSAEINGFAQVTKQRGGAVICLTWEPESPLGKISDVVLVIRPDVRGEGEGVLPFGSTLANGAVGDAICLAAKRLRGFDLATLVQTHPAGATSELVKK
jgi:arabinose-5-phosphate isomerase